MSHVNFFRKVDVSCHLISRVSMSLGSMSHVDFKKWPNRPIGFRGEGPLFCRIHEVVFSVSKHVQPKRGPI